MMTANPASHSPCAVVTCDALGAEHGIDWEQMSPDVCIVALHGLLREPAQRSLTAATIQPHWGPEIGRLNHARRRMAVTNGEKAFTMEKVAGSVNSMTMNVRLLFALYIKARIT